MIGPRPVALDLDRKWLEPRRELSGPVTCGGESQGLLGHLTYLSEKALRIPPVHT